MPRPDPGIWNGIFATWDVEKKPFPSRLAVEVGQVFEEALPKGASLLEAGSGSGELSAYLASLGYKVVLLDFSDVALSVSKELLRKHDLCGTFQKGDLFDLPFVDGAFNCVWNCGVLEHYTDQEIVSALREMARVSKELVITVVPNAGAILYRLGKWELERKGTWPYGEEYPKASMRELFAKAGLRLVREDYLAVDMGVEWLHNVKGFSNELVDLVHEWQESLIDQEAIKSGLAYLLLTVGIKQTTSTVVPKKSHRRENAKELAKSVSDLQGQVSEIEHLLVRAHEQKGERIRHLQTQVAEGEATIQDLRTQVTQGRGSIEALQGQLTQGEAVIQDLQAQLAQGKESIEALQGQLTHREATIQDLRTQVTQGRGSIEALQGQLTQGEAVIQDLQAQLAQGKESIEALQGQLTHREATIQDLRTQVTQGRGSIEALQGQLTQGEAVIQDLRAQVTRGRGSIETLQGQLTQKDAAIQDLQIQVIRRRESVETLQGQLIQKDAALRGLQAQLAQGKESIEALQVQLAGKEAFIQDLQAQAARRVETIEALQAQLAEIEQRTQNLQAELTGKVIDLEAIYVSKLWRLGSFYWRMLDLAAYLSPSRLKPASLRLARRILPQPARAVLKRTLLSSSEEKLVYQRGSELTISPEQSSGSQYDIFCFPIIDWFFRFQRPQQIVSQFARNGHRIFYMNQNALLEGQLLAVSAAEPETEWVQANVAVVSLVSQSPLNIYTDELDDANLEAMFRSLDALRRQFNIVTAVCLVQLPFWAPLVARLCREFGWKIVYDCIDDHAAFSTNRGEMVAYEDQLVQDSDLVVVTSKYLHKKMCNRGVPCVVVPNAADFEHFNRAQIPLPLNEIKELQEIKHPIVGYYGAISDWFDMDLIRHAARSRPDWNFVLIGSTYGADDYLDLERAPNVHFLGEKPYARLPEYLSQFDVCCIPFKITPLTRATNPVKFYEYLSAGKPVVSVPLPELEPYADHSYLTDSADTFVRAIEQALSENDPDRVAARVALARDNNWDTRFQRLRTAILTLYPRASIIVVTYNNLKLTRCCLDSLHQFTLYPNWELIVVDNGSTDGTQDYLSTLSERFDHVQVILNRHNMGFPQATNQGSEASSGEHLVLLNNDTVVTRGWLTRLLQHFERDPLIGLVGPMTNAIWNEAKLEAHYTTSASLEAFAVQQAEEHVGEHFPIGVLAMFCLAVRRQVIDEIGLLDEQYEIGMFEDDDFALRARLAGWRAVCAQDVFIHHEGRASFKQLGEKRYRDIFETNRAKFEQKWDRDWRPHQPERRQAILRYSHELRAILERHPETARIVVFPPTIGWDIHLFQRPHQLALAFAKQGNLVFFCLDDEEASSQFSGFQQVADRLYTADVPVEIFQMLEQPLVMTLPYNSHYLTCFCRPVVVYEIIDELEVFPYNQDRLERRHNALVKSADVVLATADRLLQRIIDVRPDAILCPNGVAYERFAAAQMSNVEPLSGLKPVLDRGRPIIGYCGALARWFDYELIRYAAEARPDLTFLLIGPDHDGTLKQSGIASQPNIVWLGPRPYNVVPQYLQYFEVATIPFKVNSITLSTSPIKLFEYLAAGKSVVTTAMPECRKYEGVLVAESYAEFVAHIDRALEFRNDPAFQARLQKEAQRNTWQARIEQILEAVEAQCNGNNNDDDDDEGTVPQLSDELNGQPGPCFTAAAIAHHEPNKHYEMYQTWLDYTLGTNRRGTTTFKTVRDFTEIAGKHHLDIGCAYGGTVIAFAQAGAESVGIDIDDTLLDLARVNLSDHPDIQVNLLRRDITEPSDAADLGQFDIITCENVVEHVLNLPAMISQIVDLLKPGGWLYLTIPNGLCATEVRTDGHYGLFGITLLPREDAVAYYTAANFIGNYDVGYFLSYDNYASMLAEHDVQIKLVDHIQASDQAVAALGKRVLSLLDEFETHRTRGGIPAAICDRVAVALEDYISKFERHYAAYQVAHGAERARLGFNLIRDFGIGLWHIIGHRTTLEESQV